ncbi:FxLYD domain-containing protein [Cerasicoccus fimbriatus]|uniref:FxLYD domain-containing protein n=1 Tax=Cerasicoccus fimbriatus TaxID=3014554 RepID=UPI0022B5AD49|nr:FxLYD domain-containing protein [Cerasicoccus sp. TK19100]
MNTERLTVIQLVRIGFFVGLGFSVPLTIFTYVPMYFMGSWVVGDFEEEWGDFTEYDPQESGLEVVIESNKETEDGWVFIGQLVNNGDQSWQGVTIQIELFDAEGRFIDESDGYVEGAIAPGTTHHFKLPFYDYDLGSDINFSDFKASIIGAY